MPHRFISFNILDFILSFVPVGLVGIFDFDTYIIAHMVGCYTGALIKWGYDVKLKKMDRSWATFYALISIGAGYIIGNSFNEHYKIALVSDQIFVFMVSAIGANYLVMGAIKIFIGLEQSSWKLTKEYFKNWLKGFINDK